MSEAPFRDPYAGRRLPEPPPNKLAAALRGFVGLPEAGSVLEPGVQEARSANTMGEGLGIATDVLPLMPKAALLGALVPALRRGKAGLIPTFKNSNELFGSTGLVRVPSTNPDARATELYARHVPILDRAGGESMNDMVSRLRKSATLGNALSNDSPLMKQYGDVLQDIELKHFPMSEHPGWRGYADAHGGEIGLQEGLNATDLHEVLDHELTHTLFTKLGQENAGGMRFHKNPLDNESRRVATSIADLLKREADPQLNWLGRQTYAAAKGKDPYASSNGEWLARTAGDIGLRDYYGLKQQISQPTQTISDGVVNAMAEALDRAWKPAHEADLQSVGKSYSAVQDYLHALRKQGLFD